METSFVRSGHPPVTVLAEVTGTLIAVPQGVGAPETKDPGAAIGLAHGVI